MSTRYNDPSGTKMWLSFMTLLYLSTLASVKCCLFSSVFNFGGYTSEMLKMDMGGGLGSCNGGNILLMCKTSVGPV